MANPRELAEKAFTLLQDALRESESRATELDAELKRNRAPKGRLEERVDVLTHRLESVEEECRRWQREAANLEELLENERAKVQQLRKKLEVAESGPDKLTKKEINFWRERAEHFDAETREYKNRIASLKQELAARMDPADDGFGFGLGLGLGRSEPIGPESDLVSALEAAREETTSLRRRLDAEAAELAVLRARLADDDAGRSRTDEQYAELRAAAGTLREQLAAAERSLAETEQKHAALTAERAALAAELERAREAAERTRGELAQGRGAAEEAQAASAKMSAALRDREARLVELSAMLEKARAELASRNEQAQALHKDLEQTRAETAGRDAELAKIGNALASRERELEQAGARRAQLEKQLAESGQRTAAAEAAHRASVESLQNALAGKDAQLAAVQARHDELARELAGLDRERNDVREQISGLEAELKEEKECTANINELANERREALTRLEEKIEEVEERYEEAKWRLGKAVHFERLVRRRKGLIAALIGALRAKSKANSALKAGLDGLRNYKATAEVNQRKLLARIDKLGAELKDAEDTIARHHGATLANEELQAALHKISGLEERLETQVEIIQSLEADLKAAKAMQHARETHAAELEAARKELEAKNGIISKLEADADEQQRKLAKLRGSESETMRLRAVEEKDKSVIDALQREITQLREALSRQEAAPGPGEAQVKERDASIARLMSSVKEKDAEIAKLKESVAQWKKKYEFLSTEAPDAYQSVVEK